MHMCRKRRWRSLCNEVPFVYRYARSPTHLCPLLYASHQGRLPCSEYKPCWGAQQYALLGILASHRSLPAIDSAKWEQHRLQSLQEAALRQIASKEGPITAAFRAFSSIEAAFSILFVMVLCNSLTVTAFYWGLSSYQNLYLDNVIRHGGNVPLLLADLLVSRMPITSNHLPVSLYAALIRAHIYFS